MNGPDRWRPPDGFDDDATFADIVAHLNDDPAGIEPPAQSVTGNAATDVSGNAATDQESTYDGLHPGSHDDEPPPAQSTEPPPDGSPAARTPQVWRAHEVDDEPEEHFEPPPVSPVPVGDLQFWGIIAGMAGGPLLLVYLVFFHRDASSYWMLTAIAMSVGGFALLVSRLPGHREDDDDGARL